MPVPHLVSIFCQDEQELHEIADVLRSADANVGDISKTEKTSDLHFDPSTALDPLKALPFVYTILAVLTTEAAKELVKWVFEKLKAKKPGDQPTTIQLAQTTIVLAYGADREYIRKKLENVFQGGP
jgi:hypothetical protein